MHCGHAQLRSDRDVHGHTGKLHVHVPDGIDGRRKNVGHWLHTNGRRRLQREHVQWQRHLRTHGTERIYLHLQRGILRTSLPGNGFNGRGVGLHELHKFSDHRATDDE